MAKIMALLSQGPTAMEKAQQPRVSTCVAGTYERKQGWLLCCQTLRETDRGHVHVSVHAFTDAHFQLMWPQRISL